ncbi:MAG: type II secretion system ATPase GspE [Pseudomonadota bacterium]
MTADERLADMLSDKGKIGPGELQRAQRLQVESGERLGAILVQLGFVGERDLAQVLSEELSLPLAEPADYRSPPDLEGRLSTEFLQRSRVIPIAENETDVVLAVADPLDPYPIEEVQLALGKRIGLKVGVGADIEAACRRSFGEGGSSMEQLVESIGDDDNQDLGDIEQLRDLASEAPIIRVVNLIIAEALEAKASDIHVEPFENTLRVRYRVDGVLQEVEAPPSHSSAAVISRIKVMASLNIAERRLPQDGRVKLRIEGREVDMRISTVPTMHGESVVMRILDKTSVPLDFHSLGFTPETLPQFEEVLKRPNGVFLVTGPTGSGKTTTLYAALTALNTPERKILTVEDPVEYQLEGINQIQIRPTIGLTFADALRSILRQDPDTIMVGEMRDLETAKIAVQAALTGHQVFSTLHTNDAVASITRMLDMGLEDFLLTSTVNGVLAQRLVRTLCPQCREEYDVSDHMIEELGIADWLPNGRMQLYRAVGCERCEGRGYSGRTGILELFVMSEPLRQEILGKHDASSLKRAAVEHGMTTMYLDGIRKAMAGVTSIEEVVRVTQDG